MDAQPELAMIAKSLNEHGLEAILIGNMAAALHGAPVTTIDINFYFRKTPRNMQKLKRFATDFGAVILQPYYPVSQLYRLQRNRDSLQIDFMWLSSYEAVRKRAKRIDIGGHSVLLASLEDVAVSERTVPIQSSPVPAMKKPAPNKVKVSPADRSQALKLESERALIDLIRFRLSLPPEKRLNCLRRKIGLRATCL